MNRRGARRQKFGLCCQCPKADTRVPWILHPGGYNASFNEGVHSISTVLSVYLMFSCFVNASRSVDTEVTQCNGADDD